MRVSKGTFWGYVSAPVLVAVAVGLRLALVGPVTEPETNLLLVAVTIAALVGGLGPGLLAVALATLQEAWWQMAPVGTLWVEGARDRRELAVFVVAGCIVSFAIDRLRRARAREADAKRDGDQRERRLRAYFDSPAVGVAITSPEKGWMEVNDRLCDMLGYRREELSRLTWSELTHPDDLAADVAWFERLQAGEIERYSLDKRFVRKDGSIAWTLLSVSCARRPDGKVDFFVAVLLDIEKRKVAEEALRRSEDRFRTYVEAAPLGIFVVDERGRYQDFNQAALDMMGTDAATMRSLGIGDMVDESDRPAALAQFASLVTTGRLDQDYRLRRPAGGHVWVALRAVRIADDRFMAFCQDIGARKTAEAEALEKATYVRAIVDTALDGFWVVDGKGRIQDVNPAACAMSGYSREELLEMGIGDVEALETPEVTAARIARIREQGYDRFRTRHRRKDGTVIEVAASVRLVSLGRPLMMCFFQNVTDQHRAEVALRESERRYRTLVDGMASGLVLQASDGSIVDCNPAAEVLLGLDADEMRGRKSVDPRWRALREDGSPFPGDQHPPMVALRTGRPQVDVVMAVHKPGGELTWLSVNAQPLRDDTGKVYAVLSTFVDVTRRRKAEFDRAAMQARLAHSARLAAMGTLVAGVAHEINNPLASMTANSGTALEEIRALCRLVEAGEAPVRDVVLQRADELVEMLEDVTSSARRISRIVRDLSILGRPDQRKEPVDLAGVVAGALTALPEAITRRVEVRTEVADVPAVAASPSQLEQVLVNLIGNAALSVPEGKTGQVVVRLGPGEPGKVRVEVADDGPGIPRELQERIFEPFFTTRPLGQGTGLGLSICNAIVGAHGGTISVSSEPGHGATFRIDVPVAARSGPAPAPAVPAPGNS